jgi:hypothetical protein
MFRAVLGDYGTPHPDNGKPDNGGDAWYFFVRGPVDVGGRLSGYVTREQFNWLAERIGTPKLPEEQSK